MVLKYLLSAFLNQAKVVEKLAESRPVRRAAQLTAWAAMRAQLAARAAASKAARSNTARQIRAEASQLPRDLGEAGRKAARVKDSVLRDVKDGMDDASRQVKQHRNKK